MPELIAGGGISAAENVGANTLTIESSTGFVSVKDTGATGNGTTSDSVAIQAAIDSLGVTGGTVFIPRPMKCLVDTSITVKPNVTLKGAFTKVGSPKDNTSYPYNQMSGIILNSAATITLKGGAGIDGMLIQRKGITYPATVGSFAGTAITGGGDDNFVINSMILGFALAITTTFQRPRITDVNIDCTAGIAMSSVLDIPYLRGVHCWPFTNVGTTPASNAHRSGSAFLFTNCDWPKITECFAYGYFRGISSDGSDDMVAVNCAFDGTSAYTGSIGVAVTNDALRNRLIGLNVSSQDIGLYVNTTASTTNRVELVGSNITTSTSHSTLIDGGDVSATASTLMNAPTGFAVANAASKLSVVNCKFAAISSSPINCVPANSNLDLRHNDYGTFAGNPVGGGSVASVASAATITLPHVGDSFQITGTTTITTIQYGWAGRIVVLRFAASLTVTNGANLKLAGAANFSATADDVLTLVSDGTAWREVSRSVN